MVVDSEKALRRITKLRTSEVKRNMFGQEITREDGSLVRQENPKLLKIKADTSLKLLERLDPDNYGKVEKNENKHVIFSLSDLRKDKRKMEEEAEEAKSK